jgi:Diacylglycerol kinase catalytic domain
VQSVSPTRRLSAIVALVAVVAVLAVAVVGLLQRPLALLVALACLGVAIAAAAYALTRTGARRRGIEPVVLGPGDDLRRFAEQAVASGADVLGMAGGDGSQALVAGVAAAHDVGFVCVPAGTRNHLAMDLGLDRDDVVGALEAFGAAVERRIDLGLVGDRVFVNNATMGLYAKIVQSPAYRDHKVDTALELLPAMLGPGATPFDLRFTSPDGTEHQSAHLILVSNNRYELSDPEGFGSRRRLDAGPLASSRHGCSPPARPPGSRGRRPPGRPATLVTGRSGPTPASRCDPASLSRSASMGRRCC